MSERRKFNRTERVALFLAAEGRCEECGVELDRWHADHRQPYSHGGATDVANGAALCASCNQRKGARVLRDWQRDFVEDYFEKNQADYLLEATPGAGKTIAAAAIADRALRGRQIERVIVVVPRLALKTQITDAFHGVGVSLQPKWKPGDGWPAGFDGIVITWHTLASQPALLRTFAARATTMFIFDEAHHGGDESTWGTAMKYAAEEARYRLLTSGTPFRTKGTAIPGVRYVDGLAVPDFAYGYTDALRDEVVRYVNFHRRGGHMEWSVGDAHFAADLHDDALAEERARQALRTAIDPHMDWVRTVLDEAHRLLLDLRKSDPRAGANYQAASVAHAKAVAVALRMIAGPNAVEIATSDDDDAAAAIARFRDGHALWLVSCDMVTEGIDVPRLRLLVYAKAELTALAFRQAVGRVVRKPDEHDHSYVFIPDHPILRKFAEEIEEQIKAWLTEDVDEILRERIEVSEPRVFLAEVAQATDEGTIRSGEPYTPQEWAHAERIKMQDDATAAMDTWLVIKLLRNQAHFPAATPPEPQAPATEPEYKRHERLRTLNNRLAKQIGQQWNFEFAHVNQSANTAVGVRKIADASVEQLERRSAFLRTWLTEGEEPRRAAG